MKKLILAVAVAALAGSQALAFGNGCQNGSCNRRPGGGMPAFQAAPWYLYWPYNQHFMTPAPLMGAYYAPPSAGGMLVSPYFPAPQQAPQR